MMNNREKMMRSCRAALSVLAGVDNRTMAQVAEMRMRDHSSEVVDKESIMCEIFDERAAAASDFSL